MNTNLLRGALREISCALDCLDRVDHLLRDPELDRELSEVRQLVDRLDDLYAELLWRVDPALARHLENPQIPYRGPASTPASAESPRSGVKGGRPSQ